MILTGIFTGIGFTDIKKPYKTISSIWLSLWLVPKAGLEPARAMLTTPSRWRVYQFHHFGFVTA